MLRTPAERDPLRDQFFAGGRVSCRSIEDSVKLFYPEELSVPEATAEGSYCFEGENSLTGFEVQLQLSSCQAKNGQGKGRVPSLVYVYNFTILLVCINLLNKIHIHLHLSIPKKAYVRIITFGRVFAFVSTFVCIFRRLQPFF